METKQAHGAHVQNGTAKETNKTLPKGDAKETPPTNRAETTKLESNPLKDEKPAGPQPGHQQEQNSEAVSVKAEVLLDKPALNLEGKLKVVETLHRKSIQRLNLKSRIKQLEAFEVALTQEHDELEDNPYQGCKLIIEDDKKTQFVTTTPGLIRLVSQFIFNACHEKLAEIEASIVFPNA